MLGEAAIEVVTECSPADAAVATPDDAEAAKATRQDRAEYDALTLVNGRHPVADLVDDASDFVAGDDARLGVLLTAVDTDIRGAE